ncbi:MAG: ABC transporter substrate-binding protein [Sphingomonadaceae bacterium]
MKPIRLLLLLALPLAASCGEEEEGPIVVSAIGNMPVLVNPNLETLDPAAAFLLGNAAQGLVRFDAAGQIEPALAQSWIVSDDGLRYTFRLARSGWLEGERMTAEEVANRLRAAMSRASDNPLKPMLGAIEDIEAMTEDVLEVRLKSERPNFLQLLAQPEMAIMVDRRGSGPYRPEWREDGSVLLVPPADDGEAERSPPPLLLRGERAPKAVARFEMGLADLVIGGTIGDLPYARVADLPGTALRYDPAAGLFGIAVVEDHGLLADADTRAALAMAIDRASLAADFDIAELTGRTALLPADLSEGLDPAEPGWTRLDLAERRERGRAIIADAGFEKRRLRIALPAGIGYRRIFRHIERDWRAIGVAAEPVDWADDADLRLVDRVAPANSAGWYLRHFACERSVICDPRAEALLDAAQEAPTLAARARLLAGADRALAEAVPFIPLATPLRWSLVSPRLAGFRPNMFARHGGLELVETSAP